MDGILQGQKKINEYTTQLDTLRRQANEYDKDKITNKIREVENEISKTDKIIKRNEVRIEKLNEFEKKYLDELNKLKAEQKEFENVGSTSKKKDVYQKKIQNIKTITQFEKNIKKIKNEIITLILRYQNIQKI